MATDVSTVNAPDLTIAKLHFGNFTQGTSGASYTIVVANVGLGPTSGLVTMTDNLPIGISLNTLDGPGWTCDGALLACTRSDELDAGSSYPPITLSVNVASNAPAAVLNSTVVSGGGEAPADAANNTSSDVTTVNAIGTPITHVGTTSSKVHGGAGTLAVALSPKQLIQQSSRGGDPLIRSCSCTTDHCQVRRLQSRREFPQLRPSQSEAPLWSWD